MEAALVPAGSKRSALTGVVLPTPPPTRLYISGSEYLIQAPRIPLPPIANVVKVLLNWTSIGTAIAKNILHLRISGGTGSTSDPVFLQQVADQVMTQWQGANFPSEATSDWTLQSVTCKDAGGTSAVGLSTHGPIPGLVAPPSLPPQTAVCISWGVADSYRGGKSRTYLPGVPQSAQLASSGAGIFSSYATSIANNANYFMSHINAATVLGSTLTLGSVSYHTGHAVRPVPQFRVFLHARCHERLDSQRRRSGKEITFPATP